MRRGLFALAIVGVLGPISCTRDSGNGAVDVGVADTAAADHVLPCNLPISASSIAFVDRTTELGLDFVGHDVDGFCGMPDIMGGGVCVFDADGDDDLDLYFTDRAPHDNRLYRNDGGLFSDVTKTSGAGLVGSSMGCLAFDVEGDGDLDLYVSDTGHDRLLRNVGSMRFVDATDEVGLVEDGFTASVGAGDIDGDGDLDLAVAHFVHAPGCPAVCSPAPQDCPPVRNLLFENRAGRLIEVGVERGLVNVDPTLATLFFDADLDGDLDLYFGNDAGNYYPDRMYMNDGTGHFVEGAAAMGLAWDGTGTDSGSTMGVSIGDFDLNGTLDLVSSNFEDRHTLLFACSPGPSCHDTALDGKGLDASRPFNSWSVGFVDFDQDGWLDLFSVSGRVFAPPEQRNELYWNHGGKLEPYVPTPDEALSVANNGRSAGFGDLDGDGDIDVVVASNGGAARILTNEASVGHSLTIALDTLSVGASVKVSAGGISRTQPVLASGGYLGSSDPRVHFGLGAACSAQVDVRWLDGRHVTLADVAANQVLKVATPRR